jgi:hypothetical protein
MFVAFLPISLTDVSKAQEIQLVFEQEMAQLLLLLRLSSMVSFAGACWHDEQIFALIPCMGVL